MANMKDSVRLALQPGGALNFHYFICPHTGDEKPPCACRKPKPGMIYTAAHIFSLSLTNAWMIGDSMNDLKAGWLAGIRKLIMVGQEEKEEIWKRNTLSGKEVPNLKRAVEFLLHYDKVEGI